MLRVSYGWALQPRLLFKNDRVLSFNSANGFTDNAVPHIYNDQDNNLWFATNGAGFIDSREITT